MPSSAPSPRPRCPLALALAAAAVVVLALGSSCGTPKDRIDLTRWVLIYPGSSIVQLTGGTVRLPVVVRNVSPVKLTGLTLEVKGACCSARVEPARVAGLIPGDRLTFTVTLTRGASQTMGRSPLLLTLRSPELPVAAGMDLVAELDRPAGDRWLDVGQVKLVRQDDSRTVYFLLAGAPLLFTLGWVLWRISRRGRRTEEEQGPK